MVSIPLSFNASTTRWTLSVRGAVSNCAAMTGYPFSVRGGGTDRVMPPVPRHVAHDLLLVEPGDLRRAVSQIRQDLVRMLTQQRRFRDRRRECRKLHRAADSQIRPALLVRDFDDRAARAQIRIVFKFPHVHYWRTRDLECSEDVYGLIFCLVGKPFLDLGKDLHDVRLASARGSVRRVVGPLGLAYGLAGPSP